MNIWKTTETMGLREEFFWKIDKAVYFKSPDFVRVIDGYAKLISYTSAGHH